MLPSCAYFSAKYPTCPFVASYCNVSRSGACLQDVSGGKPVLLEGTDGRVYGMEIDLEQVSQRDLHIKCGTSFHVQLMSSSFPAQKKMRWGLCGCLEADVQAAAAGNNRFWTTENGQLWLGARPVVAGNLHMPTF